MSNLLDIDPSEFPECISCNSSIDVDVDEIDEVWVCHNCNISWGSAS